MCVFYMSIRDVKNEIIHMMEKNNYDENRRQVIFTTLQAFLNSKYNTDVISIAIRNQKNDNVISISKIPNLISIIVLCLKSVDFTKSLKTQDMKYFIYGVLYSFILNEDVNFFSDVNIETFESLYEGIYDILMIVPSVVEVGSNMCKVLC